MFRNALYNIDLISFKAFISESSISIGLLNYHRNRGTTAIEVIPTVWDLFQRKDQYTLPFNCEPRSEN